MSGILSLPLFCLVRLTRLNERSNAFRISSPLLGKQDACARASPKIRVRRCRRLVLLLARQVRWPKSPCSCNCRDLFPLRYFVHVKRQPFLRRPPPQENKCLFWIRARGWINTSYLSSVPLGCVLFLVQSERCRPH